MLENLTWYCSAFSSFLYAVRESNESSQLLDPEVDVSKTVARVNRLLRDGDLDPVSFWSRIVSTTALHEDLSDAVRQAIPNDAALAAVNNSVWTLLQGLQQAMSSRWGDRESILQARQGPIRRQWEARGPGLLKAFERATKLSLPAACHVVLVEPRRVGAMQPVFDLQTVEFEALLTDIPGGLPEVVRLAWGLCCLSPQLQELRTEPSASIDVGAISRTLAILPPLLRAAEHVELATASVESIEIAMRAWDLASRGFPEDGTNRQVAQRLFDWWEESRKLGNPWVQSLSRLR